MPPEIFGDLLILHVIVVLLQVNWIEGEAMVLLILEFPQTQVRESLSGMIIMIQ